MADVHTCQEDSSLYGMRRVSPLPPWPVLTLALRGAWNANKQRPYGCGEAGRHEIHVLGSLATCMCKAWSAKWLVRMKTTTMKLRIGMVIRIWQAYSLLFNTFCINSCRSVRWRLAGRYAKCDWLWRRWVCTARTNPKSIRNCQYFLAGGERNGYSHDRSYLILFFVGTYKVRMREKPWALTSSKVFRVVDTSSYLYVVVMMRSN